MLSTSQVDILFSFVEVLVQTLAYGIFIAIIPIAAHSLSKQGLALRPNVVMFAITLSIFLLSTAYWAISVGFLIAKVAQLSTFKNSGIRQLFNAIALISYVFADGVVVWRMGVLCKEQFPKPVLRIPTVILGLTTLSVCTTIGLRIAITVQPGGAVPRHSPLATSLDVIQITNLVLSLLTNLSATIMISIWAWRYRKSIATNLRASSTSTQVERIMVLVAESGVIYCVSSIIVLISSFIRVPGGTLGDIYTGIHAQIAGMYPALVMILVNYQRSSEGLVSTSFVANNFNFNPNSSKATPIGSLRFTDGPEARSHNLTSTMQTGHSTVHVTIDMHGQDDSLGTISEGEGGDDLEAYSRDQANSEYDWRRVKLNLE
ncbi:hypothetical protein BDY19DRAFT_300721 [Irpex rosettiformis]|uniref:Uncharacterized protein n=1 Tax=Irpex rosettiformis TaxID=378272 RepID=A0ACB8TYT0_9APHY|nr:hypothetical protein BDY19DRAFT_300721 [Irpex rosettiformis]